MVQLACDAPDLPALGPGVHCLDCTDSAVGPLHSLVLDHLLTHDGPAWWVDSHGHATTHPLARLAPSRRLLDRVRVARGFTAFQHHTLLETLVERVEAGAGGDADDRPDDGPALVVLPAVDALYRDDDLARGEPARFLESVAERVGTLADRADAPVLLTVQGEDALTAPLLDVIDDRLQCERTRFGPRFVGPGFETLVYRAGGAVQTTLAFWERVLAARHEAVRTDAPLAAPEVA